MYLIEYTKIENGRSIRFETKIREKDRVASKIDELNTQGALYLNVHELTDVTEAFIHGQESFKVVLENDGFTEILLVSSDEDVARNWFERSRYRGSGQLKNVMELRRYPDGQSREYTVLDSETAPRNVFTK